MTGAVESGVIEAPVAATVSLSGHHVETAVPADEEQVMDLCRMKHAEIGIFPLGEAKVRADVQNALRLQHGLIGVIRVEGRVVACICLMVSRLHYTEAEHLAEFFDFVHPDYRRSNFARLLIKFAKHCSDKLGKPLFMGVFTTKQTQAKAALYGRMLEPVGFYFMHNRHLAESWKQADPPASEAS